MSSLLPPQDGGASFVGRQQRNDGAHAFNYTEFPLFSELTEMWLISDTWSSIDFFSNSEECDSWYMPSDSDAKKLVEWKTESRCPK